MNRQEKRRLKRNINSNNEFQLYKEREVIVMFLGLCMEALSDEFGFGDKRLKRFGKRVDEKLSCIVEDYVTFDDILENLSIKEK